MNTHKYRVNIHRKLIFVLLLSQLCLTLYGCVLPRENAFDAKTGWMEKNFPDHAKYLEQIQYDPKFKQAILDGQIMPEMSFDEVLVAAEIKPYGPNPAEKVFWCQNKLVPQCDASCANCRAMLVRKRKIHFFETAARGLQLVDSFPNNKWQAHLSYFPSSYSAARSILRNEFAVGMHLDDIAQVARPPRSETQYYCGAENQGRSDIPCSANCPSCRVEIHIPRSGRNSARVIELHFQNGVLDHLQQRQITH